MGGAHADLLQEAEGRRCKVEAEVEGLVAEVDAVRARMEERARSFAAEMARGGEGGGHNAIHDAGGGRGIQVARLGGGTVRGEGGAGGEEGGASLWKQKQQRRATAPAPPARVGRTGAGVLGGGEWVQAELGEMADGHGSASRAEAWQGGVHGGGGGQGGQHGIPPDNILLESIAFCEEVSGQKSPCTNPSSQRRNPL